MSNRILAMSGSRLAAEEAASLEKRVKQDPQDINARIQLLGFYFRKQNEDPAAQKANHENILWFIQNAPEAEILATPFGLLYEKTNAVGYSLGKKAWIDQLNNDPENLKLLKNAAKYFLLTDQELAEEYLLKGQSLDQNNPEWSEMLGQLYSLSMLKKSDNDERSEAKKALEQLENAYHISTEIEQNALLPQLAEAALAAEEMTKATEYAEIMLSQSNSDWNCGSNIHHGNMTLGRIAFAVGNIEVAKERLLKAGNTPGSPQLDSFGPDMTLAKALLQKGESDVVLEYLELCSKFWEMGKDRLVNWTEMIKNDQTPSEW